MEALQLSLPHPWCSNKTHLQLGKSLRPLRLLPSCALSKQGQRFFTSLATSVTGDPLVTDRLIRKFIASSSKSVALNALSHLLTPNSSHPHLSSLAFPFYSLLTRAPWFSWNPKLVADVIAMLYKQERFREADALISETVSKLDIRERELCTFYCCLIEFHSKHKSKQGVFDSYTSLKQILSCSSSVYLKRRAYESMICSLCVIDLPREAENMMEEMKVQGITSKPSLFELRSIVYAYGRVGLFKDMKRLLFEMESEGIKMDTVCFNMVLSSLGAHAELLEMVSWLQRMKYLNVPLSIRTYNTVLNSCPSIMSMLQDPKSIPLSLNELQEGLCDNESMLVQELIVSSVLVEAMGWTSLELKLDLHGMHLSSAYLIILQWFDELRTRFQPVEADIPAEVRIICGSGKHSTVRGDSPVKHLVKVLMVRTESPLRIDRKNIGCFVAKGKVCKSWLC